MPARAKSTFASEHPAASRLRILIVDDSVVARAVISRIVSASDRFVIAGAVANAGAAKAFLAQNEVDVVLLDLEMPGVDGLTALPDLIAAGRGARVIIVSTACGEGAAATIQALSLGAADTLVKPGAGQLAGRFAHALEEKLLRLFAPAESAMVGRSSSVSTGQVGDDYDIVAIGASTGGIHALSQMLRAIPASFQLPILITQHLPASFMPYFAAQVSVLAGRPCEVGINHLRVRPGRVIIAPGDAHLTCVDFGEGVAIKLTRARARSGCMPSVDPMFESLAGIYGERLLAIVLSGMGRDGTEGARHVAEAGGTLAVQDEQTSVVWGMPGSIAAAGLARVILPPDEIGRMIVSQRRPA